MKILFIGGEKDNIHKLVNWINEFTSHTAYICEKDTNEVPVAAPISDPDIMIMMHNYMERNDEMGMGILSKPIRVFYSLGAPHKGFSLGVGQFDWRFKAFNKYFASYTPLDIEHYKYWDEYSKIYKNWFSDLIWLPYPDEVEDKSQVSIDLNKDFTVATSLSFMTMAGAYSKQTDLLLDVQRNLGFKLDIIHSISRNDCWDRIKQVHLYFGNMTRGAVSVSEKEAMSFGIPAMSWLRNEEKSAYENMGVNFPLINVNPETLETVIKSFMDNPTLCVTKGQECFDWMHTNYTHSKIAQYWVNQLEILLEKEKN